LTAVNFPSGRFRCESSLLDLTLAEGVKWQSVKSGYVFENTRKINYPSAVTERNGLAKFFGIRRKGLKQWPLSVSKMTDAGEDHRQVETVGRGDDFFIANGAAGLNDGGYSVLGCFFHAIGKGEKSVGANNRSG
jgi:hypothetical protein